MGDLTIRVQGLVDRIETVPDGKYVHIWIKEAQKPLTITADELEKGFKPKPGNGFGQRRTRQEMAFHKEVWHRDWGTNNFSEDYSCLRFHDEPIVRR